MNFFCYPFYMPSSSLKKETFLGILVSAIIFSSSIGFSAPNFLKYFTFSEEGVMKIWKDKLHKGKVDYKLVTESGDTFVQAHSKKAASGIYYEFPEKLRFNPTSKPFISWKWKVDKFPTKDPSDPKDDYAARVYVIFPASVIIFSNCIEYIWDDTLPEGTIKKSPLSSRIQLFVLRKGKKDGWQHEERNIAEDYMKAFGESEVDDEIGAIAFMSDTDDTQSEAAVSFDDIKIGYSTPILKK